MRAGISNTKRGSTCAIKGPANAALHCTPRKFAPTSLATPKKGERSPTRTTNSSATSTPKGRPSPTPAPPSSPPRAGSPTHGGSPTRNGLPMQIGARPQRYSDRTCADPLPPAATCMTLTESGLWVGTVKGLYVRPAGSRELVLVNPADGPGGEPQVRCLWRAGRTMWVGFSIPIIHVLDVHTFELIAELACPGEGVQCMGGDRRLLFTGGADQELSMWDTTTFLCLKTFSGHTAPIRAILLDGDLVYSGSDDCMVIVWELVTRQQVRYLQGHTMGVSSLLRTQNHLWSGSDDCTIKVWDVETGACLNTLESHTGPILSMLLLGGTVWTATVDGISLWDEQGHPAGDCPIKGQGALKDLQSVVWAESFKVLVARDSGIEVWNHTVDCHGADLSVQHFTNVVLRTVAQLQEQVRTMTDQRLGAMQQKEQAKHEADRLMQLSVEQQQRIVALERQVEELAQQCQLLQEDHGRLLLDNDVLREALNCAASPVSSARMSPATPTRDAESARQRDLSLKLQELAMKKEDLEDTVRELEQLLRTKWDEVQELSRLVLQRDTSIGCLKGIIEKQEEEKQTLVRKLDALELALRSSPVPAQCVSCLQPLQWDSGESSSGGRRGPEVEERRRSGSNSASRDFVTRTRPHLVRAIFQLWENVSTSDKVAGSAIDVIRNMIFTLHNADELKGYDDTIRHLYAPLFQLLDLVRVSHHQTRQMLTLYLTDVERMTLGLPSKGFESKMSRADQLEAEDEIAQIHAQYLQHMLQHSTEPGASNSLCENAVSPWNHSPRPEDCHNRLSR
eukprot:GGOE01020756.1.p1 GENE.GGOE01020756.1~~GGOE01020756.1.p1  ORF type:complete len:815 (+),score=186.38 GGOE01020756.1:69-2447(+)